MSNECTYGSVSPTDLEYCDTYFDDFSLLEKCEEEMFNDWLKTIKRGDGL